MKYAIAKVSSKGQIVIPSSLRADVRKGDEFLMVKDRGRIILKSMKLVASSFKDDLIFADRVENAWKEHDKGKFKSKTKDDFLKALRSC